MAVKITALRVFKILGIVAACVVGAFALVFGGVLLFGGNTPVIPPRDLAFKADGGNMITGSSHLLNLQVISETVDITEDEVLIKIEKGADLLAVQQSVVIGEYFQVAAKTDSFGNRKGGVAVIRAYTKDQLVTSQELEIYIDVLANGITLGSFDSNVFSLGKSEDFENFIGSQTQVTPANAQNPGHSYSGEGPFDREKTIYYFLLEDSLGTTLLGTGANIAGFSLNGSAWANAINSKQVEASISSVLQAGTQQGRFYLQACMFKSFKDDDYYKDSNNAEIFGLLRGAAGESLFVKTVPQAFAVQDIRVGDLEVAGGSLPVYLYEEKEFVAYSQDNSLANFGLRLLPADSIYNAEDLDKFLGEVTISEVGTNYLNISKTEGTSGAGTKWKIRPINFAADMLSEEGFSLTLKASYTTFEGVLLEKTLTLNIKPRQLGAGVVNINYKGQDSFVVDGSKSFSQSPEQVPMGGGVNGQKYVTVVSDGSGIITFGNLMFYLNKSDIEYIPSEDGTYKAVFDLFKASGIGPQVTHGGNTFGGVKWHYINADNTTGNEIDMGALLVFGGRVRAVCEGVTDVASLSVRFNWQQNNSNLTEWVKDMHGEDIVINTTGDMLWITDSVNHSATSPELMRNVKFYEQPSGATTYNTYPYLKVRDATDSSRWITLYIPNEQFNSSTGLIDATDATISAMGYGEFRVYAAVVASTLAGANIRDDNGDYITYKRAETRVVVTNTIENLNIYLTDLDGNKLDTNTDSGDPTDYLPLVVEENNSYYLVLSIEGTNTPSGLLKQMIESEFMKLNLSYYSEYGILQNGGRLSVNPNAEAIYDNGNPLTGNLVAYRYRVEVDDIYTIEYDEEGTKTEIPAVFKIEIAAQYAGENNIIEDYFITARDKVIKLADLDFYTDGTAEGQNEKSIWAAGMNNDGSIIWKLGEGETFGNTIIDLTQFEHRFFGEGGSEIIGIAPVFALNVDSSVARVVFDGSGRYILIIDNVPYDPEGFEIVVSIKPSGGNGRFVYTGETDYAWSEYAESQVSYTFKVYGFQIVASVEDASTEYQGSLGSTINLLSRLNFNVTDANGSAVIADNIPQGGYGNVKLSKLINFTISGGGVFVLHEDLTIEVMQDIESDKTVIVGLKIGLDDFAIAYHNIVFKSPFTIEIDEAYQHETGGVPTGKVVMSAPDFDGVDLSEVFTISNGNSAVNESGVIYELDADSLAAAGLEGLVSLIYNDLDLLTDSDGDGNPANDKDKLVLFINNFSGTREIKIYIKTMIANVDLGGGEELVAKEVKLPCIMVLESLWGEGNIVGGINNDADIEIVGDGQNNTLSLDLLGQDSRLQSITAVKSGNNANRIDFATGNNTLTIRGFETTESYQVALMITLHFFDGAEVEIAKTITVLPYLESFSFADYEMGADDTMRVLNPATLTDTYSFNKPGQEDLLGSYIDDAILYAGENGTQPFEIDLSEVSFSPTDVRIRNSGGDQYLFEIVNYESVYERTLEVNPNAEFVVLPVKIHVPIRDAGAIRYLLTYTINITIVFD